MGVDDSLKNPRARQVLFTGWTESREGSTLLCDSKGGVVYLYYIAVRTVFCSVSSLFFSVLYNIIIFSSIYFYYIIIYLLWLEMQAQYTHACTYIILYVCIICTYVPWPLETPLSSGTAVNLDGISVLRTTRSLGRGARLTSETASVRS